MEYLIEIIVAFFATSSVLLSLAVKRKQVRLDKELEEARAIKTLNDTVTHLRKQNKYLYKSLNAERKRRLYVEKVLTNKIKTLSAMNERLQLQLQDMSVMQAQIEVLKDEVKKCMDGGYLNG